MKEKYARKHELYRLTSPSGKCYVGQTKRGVQRRFAEHVDGCRKWVEAGRPRKSYQTKLFYALAAHPAEEWLVETIGTYDTQAEVDAAEIEAIEKHDSANNGYNVTLGGQGLLGLDRSPEHCANLSKARSDYYASQEGIEWKKQLSERFKTDNPCKKGNVPWNKGKN